MWAIQGPYPPNGLQHLLFVHRSNGLPTIIEKHKTKAELRSSSAIEFSVHFTFADGLFLSLQSDTVCTSTGAYFVHTHSLSWFNLVCTFNYQKKKKSLKEFLFLYVQIVRIFAFDHLSIGAKIGCILAFNVKLTPSKLNTKIPL